MKKYFVAKLIILTVLICVFCLASLCACSVNKTSSGGEVNHAHLYGPWRTVETPTCTAEGESERFCSCGERQTTVLSPIGHDYVMHSERQATCIEVGWHEYRTCSRCDYTDYTEIPSLGHEFGEWTESTASTCFKSGEEIRICSHGIHIETRELPTIEHTEGEWIIAVKPTCDTDGERVKRCTVCSCELETEIITALGHNWANGVCSVCGCAYSN